MAPPSTEGWLQCAAESGCGAWRPMGNPAYFNRVGWPRCCGETMLWRASRRLPAYASYTAASRNAYSHAEGGGVGRDTSTEAEDLAEREGGE